MPGTPLGMLVPPELEPEELLLGLDEPWVDPLCPDGLDDGLDGEEEGDEGDEDELLGEEGVLLGDEGELLGDEGELLGDGMLGDGMPEDGLLGGGWLLLFDEHPARASRRRHEQNRQSAAGPPVCQLLNTHDAVTPCHQFPGGRLLAAGPRNGPAGGV